MNSGATLGTESATHPRGSDPEFRAPPLRRRHGGRPPPIALVSDALHPNRSALLELAARAEIQLAETPFPLLLVAHQAAQSSGLLIARRGPVEKRLVFDHGVPVDCRSNLAHETLSRFLVTAGKLTDEIANAALSRSVAQGRLLGDLLVAEQRIEAAELQRLLQQSLARKLFDLFTWKEGEIGYQPGSFPTEAALKVKVSRLVLTGISRFASQETVDRAVPPLNEEFWSTVAGAAALREELRPTEREAALLDALAQPRALADLVTQIAAPLEEIQRLVWGLSLLGLVAPMAPLSTPAAPTLAVAPEPIAAATPTPLPPSAPTPAAPPLPVAPQPSLAPPSRIAPPTPVAAPHPRPAVPPATENFAQIRDAVSRAYVGHKLKDPFDLFATSEDATPDEIRNRFFAFARGFSPWRFEHPELTSVAHEAEDLFVAGALAFAQLSDSLQREALRTARRMKREETRRESSASFFRIETDLLDAGLQFKKGMAHKEARRWSQALQLFDFAADCDPQNGTYRAEAARCRFLLAPSTMGSKVLAELQEAQRVDPDSVEACLYAGEIAAQLTRHSEAEGHYRKAARLLGPDDRRALDALRELAKKKKR